MADDSKALTVKDTVKEDSQFESIQEYTHFYPGHLTLARSDRNSNSLQIQKIMAQLQERCYFTISEGCKHRVQRAQMAEAIMKPLRRLMDEHNRSQASQVARHVTIMYTNDLNGGSDEGDNWILVLANDKDRAALQRLAEDMHKVAQDHGFPDIHCVVEHSPRWY